MSTVLEKPVLLDETGQEIVSKLGEIKDAIDNGGVEKYPVLIHITTPPVKTIYKVGEPIDYTGMVIKAVFSNNVEYDITSQCTISPAAGTPFAITSAQRYMEMTASYIWHPTSTTFTTSLVLTWDEMEYLRITTPPTKTSYTEGDLLDLTGMVVKKIYHDGSEVDVTNQCTFSPADGTELTASINEVTAYYTDSDNPSHPTWQAWQQITVEELSLFGVEWDGSASPSLTRTDSAASFTNPIPYYAGMSGTPSSPFDNIAPWKNMTIVEMTDDRFGENKYVRIPKFWYKLEKHTSGFKLQISNKPRDGFSVSPAHQDKNDGIGERDNIYIARYPLHDSSNNITAYYYDKDKTEIPTSAEKSNGYRVMDYATYMTILMLAIVEFANFNIPSLIGIDSYTSGKTVKGTDSMPYHTGTMASSKSTNDTIQYRYIEHIYCGLHNLITGMFWKRDPSASNKYALYLTKDLTLIDTERIEGNLDLTKGSLVVNNDDTSLEDNQYTKDFVNTQGTNTGNDTWMLFFKGGGTASGYMCGTNSSINMTDGASNWWWSKKIGVITSNLFDVWMGNQNYCTARLMKISNNS